MLEKSNRHRGLVALGVVAAMLMAAQPVAQSKREEVVVCAKSLKHEFRRAKSSEVRVDILRELHRICTSAELRREGRVLDVLKAGLRDSSASVVTAATEVLASLPERAAAVSLVVGRARQLRRAIERLPKPDYDGVFKLRMKLLSQLPPVLGSERAKRLHDKKVRSIKREIERVKKVANKRGEKVRAAAVALADYSGQLSGFAHPHVVTELSKALDLLLVNAPEVAVEPAVALCVMGRRESVEVVVSACGSFVPGKVAITYVIRSVEFEDVEPSEVSSPLQSWPERVGSALSGLAERIGASVPPSLQPLDYQTLREFLKRYSTDAELRARLELVQDRWDDWWQDAKDKLPSVANGATR